MAGKTHTVMVRETYSVREGERQRERIREAGREREKEEETE